ncbi:hypothetical protein PRIPAC_70195 [Pristionchus pacificus]|nr:hypothetical protein PRIPAC_70195 [Pristionchus pacificus]
MAAKKCCWGYCPMEILAQSRLLAVLNVIFSIYNLFEAIRFNHPVWIIAIRTVLFLWLGLAAVATFEAIRWNEPFLLVPIIGLTVITMAICLLKFTVAVTTLVSPESFFGEYVKETHTPSDLDDETRREKAATFAKVAIGTSTLVFIVGIRNIFVHSQAYKILKERATRKPEDCAGKEDPEITAPLNPRPLVDQELLKKAQDSGGIAGATIGVSTTNMTPIVYGLLAGTFGIFSVMKFRRFLRGGLFTEPVSAIGKVAVVTGANTGIGLETVRELNKRGAKVYMLCRNEQRAVEAIRDLEESGCDASRLSFINCDLCSKENVRACAKTIYELSDSIDILINNAGLAVGKYQLTADGHEMTWATNHLGPFLLTELLLPLIEKAPEGRIVNVSSIGHTKANTRVENEL